MTKVCDIERFLEEKAPKSLKMDFDNVGLLVGHGERPVDRILTALDITEDVIAEAAELGTGLIVSHHPLFFELKAVTDEKGPGRRVLSLVEHGIAAICMHTNLDAAQDGVSDTLMDALGGTVTGVLSVSDGMGRVGCLPEEMQFCDFLKCIKQSLHANGLRYHSAGRPVRHLACCGGSGGGELMSAYEAGCDTYVTADVKYDQFILAKELGINLVDADHFCTENTVVPVLAGWLKKAFPDVEVAISQRHGETSRFY
jgi:dinuclear metal center YbgI/SA1388 family protein